MVPFPLPTHRPDVTISVIRLSDGFQSVERDDAELAEDVLPPKASRSSCTDLVPLGEKVMHVLPDEAVELLAGPLPAPPRNRQGCRAHSRELPLDHRAPDGDHHGRDGHGQELLRLRARAPGPARSASAGPPRRRQIWRRSFFRPRGQSGAFARRPYRLQNEYLATTAVSSVIALRTGGGRQRRAEVTNRCGIARVSGIRRRFCQLTNPGSATEAVGRAVLRYPASVRAPVARVAGAVFCADGAATRRVGQVPIRPTRVFDWSGLALAKDAQVGESGGEHGQRIFREVRPLPTAIPLPYRVRSPLHRSPPGGETICITSSAASGNAPFCAAPASYSGHPFGPPPAL